MSRVALCGAVVAAAFLAALHGLQAIGRAAVLIVAGVVAGIVFVFLALLPQMDPLCFAPPLYDGFSPVIAGALEELPRTLEVVSIGLLLPYVKGNMTRHYITWTVLVAAGVILIQATSAGVLGDYGELVLFPYYTAVTTAQIGVLQRVDILAASLWLAALFVKMAFFAMQFLSCLQRHRRAAFQTVVCGGRRLAGADFRFAAGEFAAVGGAGGHMGHICGADRAHGGDSGRWGSLQRMRCGING